MKSHARVVVIGGGVVGVSTLYHLTLKGWSDVMLLERRELASGSTWHAAGLLPLFNMSYSVGQIHKYSVRLYTALQEKDGHELGLRRVSNIRLATTPDRMDEYRQYAGVAETIGVKVEFLTPEEVIDIWPLAVSDGLIGAIRHPDDGYIQPSDLTQTFARLARAGGAEINRGVTVKAIERSASGEWTIITDAGEVTCEHVVSASGNFARQTGRMVGLDIPVIPVEHQYIVTEPHPDIQARHERGEPEMGVLRESDGSWYMREEAGGLLLGPYEKGAPACYVDGPDPDAEYELFQDDIERLEPHIESAINRVPPSARPASNRSTTAPLPTRPTAARSSDRPGTCPISGSTRVIPSASPLPAGPAGSWPNGSSRARQPLTCSASTRADSAPMPRATISSEKRGSLRERFHDSLSRRGTTGRSAAEDCAVL